MGFQIGDSVVKHSGDYHVEGEVRAVFTTKFGKVLYAVEIEASLGGSFLHIYSDSNLVLKEKS